MLFLVAVFTIQSHMVISDLLVVATEFVQLFFSCLTSCLSAQKSLLLEIETVLILIAGQSSSMNIEVLVLVLSLILALESFQIFHVLLLEA